MKSRSYVPGNKIWFNSKYIKTKQLQKLKAKFFRSFRVLYLVGKQAYKLKLSKKWRIYDVFYVLLLEEDTTRKGWVDKKDKKTKFEAGDKEEYEVKRIQNSAIYGKKLEKSHLPKLYYLVSWKGYSKKKNT